MRSQPGFSLLLLPMIIIGLVLLILSGILLLPSALSPRSVSAASSLACSQQPSGQNCTGKSPADPAQGCHDPSFWGTLGSISIMDGNQIVGRIDARYSTRCMSWWGRAFIYNDRKAHFFQSEGTGLDAFKSTCQGTPARTQDEIVALPVQNPDHGQYTPMLFAPDNPPELYTIRAVVVDVQGNSFTTCLTPHPVSH